MIQRVELSKRARKDLARVPSHIAIKLDYWITAIEKEGLEQVRKVPGFHDEPLKGFRAEQRSIRLSRAYRAIYRVVAKNTIEFVLIEEVNKHEY